MPYLPLYVKDWLSDTQLRTCSFAARGMWIDLLCLMQQCEPSGVLATDGRAWTDDEIVQAVAGDHDIARKCLHELLDKAVASRTKTGALFNRRLVRDDQTRKKDKERKKLERKKGKAASESSPKFVQPQSGGIAVAPAVAVALSSADSNAKQSGGVPVFTTPSKPAAKPYSKNWAPPVPSGVDPDTWREYVKVRLRRGCTNSDVEMEVVNRRLNEFAAQGFSKNEVLENAIESGTASLFVKHGERKNGRAEQEDQRRRDNYRAVAQVAAFRNRRNS